MKPLSLHLCETLQYNKILINSDTHFYFYFCQKRQFAVIDLILVSNCPVVTALTGTATEA